jgi:type II secretory pathway pseudopilin PulG
MKKSRLLVLALLGLLSLSLAGCLFSFVYVSIQDSARQDRLRAFRDFASQEQAAQALEKEYRDWQKLPLLLQEFRKNNILSMDQFAEFRRGLDSSLSRNRLPPPRIDLSFGSKKDNFREVTVKFSLEGGYRDLKKFIYDMEAKTGMHFFTAMQLSTGGVAVKGAFTLEVYLGE